MRPTSYQNINKLLEILLSHMQNILGEKLLGLYLYGSLVTGDFDQNTSDIDLLAVLETDLDDKEFEVLQKMHQDFANKYKEWDNRIEVQYMPKLSLKNFKTKESEVVVISPGEPFHKKIVGKHFLINWYIVQEKGLTLFGEDPKTIIDHISKEEFIQSSKEHVKNWGEWVKNMRSKRAQGYTILTLCRALYADRKGEHVSKKQAALWAKKELPQWADLIDNAIFWKELPRVEDIKDKETYPKTEKFVNFVRDLIIN